MRRKEIEKIVGYKIGWLDDFIHKDGAMLYMIQKEYLKK